MTEIGFNKLKGREIIPITMDEFVTIARGTSYVLAHRRIGEWLISTVFLGIDHPGGIFETMHFPSCNQWRCHTYADALKQHAAVCRERTHRAYWRERCQAQGIPTHKRIRVMKKRAVASGRS